ncbi:MAG: hypothetical protein MJZ72_06640 [Bacteroidales bacterium]|nr:hypothetical protein [Bacteroidales bacterium]
MEHNYTLTTENFINTEEIPSRKVISALLIYSQSMQVITLPNGEKIIVNNN